MFSSDWSEYLIEHYFIIAVFKQVAKYYLKPTHIVIGLGQKSTIKMVHNIGGYNQIHNQSATGSTHIGVQKLNEGAILKSQMHNKLHVLGRKFLDEQKLQYIKAWKVTR